jgi:hypothetical protein
VNAEFKARFPASNRFNSADRVQPPPKSSSATGGGCKSINSSLFIAEKGSDKMLLFATAEDDRNKVVSAAAQVEARSAVCRLRKAKSITPAEATMAIDAIAAESRRMIEQPNNPQVIEAAKILVDRRHLRAMDAI